MCAVALALVAGAGQAVAAPPAPTITGPTGVVSQPPSYTITGDSGSTIRWRLCQNVGGQPNNCRPIVIAPSPATTGPLPSAGGADGDYTVIALQVVASQTPPESPGASASFTLNSAPAASAPTVTGPAALVNDATPTFTWTSPAPGGSSFAWELHRGGDPSGALVDSGTTGATTATPATPLADGMYAFRVSLVAGGTPGPWSATHVVTVDLTPPAAPQITSPAPAPGVTSPSFSWSGGEPGGQFRWQVLDGAGAAVVAPTTTSQTQATVPSPLAAGSYTLDVVALDAAGNVSPPAQLAFAVTPAAAGPPPSIGGLVLTPGVGQVGLSWTLVPTPTVAAVRIVRREGTSPAGPSDPGSSMIEVAPAAGSYIDPGLTPGARYYYAVYARDVAGVFSPVAATGNAVPAAPPPPPPPVAGQTVPPGAVTPPGPAVLPVTAPPTTSTPTKPSPRPLTVNPRLLRPSAGAALRVRTPLLRWRGRPGGTVLFNLQIFDAKGKKVFKAFPRGQSFRVPAGVLKPGKRYFWRVWAWFGPVRKFSPRPLGVSYFEFKAPRISAGTARKAAPRAR
jgi:large repetitive protein